MTDDQLKVAIERQLRKSMQARAEKEGKRLTSQDARHMVVEAREEATLIVEAIRNDADHDSVKVLRALKDKVPLLSDAQVADAIARQLSRSGSPPPYSPIAPVQDHQEENMDRGGGAPEATSGGGEGPKGRSRLGGQVSSADGTITFTADQLQAVSYKDVKLPQ